ncbi:MAG TPA: BON domain-containing protein [Gemmatimonadaceae bacterium]|nr:BON domain-containing protein [Gemmatimonadaceae bacterium]
MANPEPHEEERDGRLGDDGVGSLTDRQIREDVLEALGNHADLDMSGVEVYVRLGRVTLGGIVDTREEKRAARAAAEQSPGVTSVRNEIRVENDDAPLDAGWGEAENEEETDSAGSHRTKLQ